MINLTLMIYSLCIISVTRQKQNIYNVRTNLKYATNKYESLWTLAIQVALHDKNNEAKNILMCLIYIFKIACLII